LTGEKIVGVGRRDEREQLHWLKYHRAITSMGRQPNESPSCCARAG
jgi:hypothetical protein